MLARVIVGIILLYMHILNHYLVHLKLGLYVNYISIKNLKNKSKISGELLLEYIVFIYLKILHHGLLINCKGRGYLYNGESPQMPLTQVIKLSITNGINDIRCVYCDSVGSVQHHLCSRYKIVKQYSSLGKQSDKPRLLGIFQHCWHGHASVNDIKYLHTRGRRAILDYEW